MNENQRMETARFGQRTLWGGFREVLAFDEDCVTIRRRLAVPWQEVAAKRAYPNFYQDHWLGWLRPRIRVYLRDGRSFLFPCSRLASREEAGRPASRRWGELPSSYLDLVRNFERRGVPEWTGPKEEVTLLQVAAVLAILFALSAYVLGTATLNVPTSELDAVVAAAWVGGGFLAFAVTPFIARRGRRRHMSHLGVLGSDHSGSGLQSPL